MPYKVVERRKHIIKHFVFGLFLVWVLFLFGGCYNENHLFETDHDLLKISGSNYQTKNVVVVVVDGPRQSETWGDPEHRYIPKMAKELAPQGVVLSNFYNSGITFTIPGHTAITTGYYDNISNNGWENPKFPSFFQMWLKISNMPDTKAWIVASKAKLNVLADCGDMAWRNSFNPSVDAEDREDKLTFNAAINIFNTYKPQLFLIHFRGPDHYGHEGNWENYLQSIVETDSLAYEIWNYLGNDDFYKNKTTFIITNDHGRHLDNIADGFIGHGDNCSGCTHINFFATGPDFKKNMIIVTHREQIDILPTVGELMGFTSSGFKRKVMWELFKN
jgi:arylsulfatase A-like enzyme